MKCELITQNHARWYKCKKGGQRIDDWILNLFQWGGEVPNINQVPSCGNQLICPSSRHFCVDDFPFPKVGYGRVFCRVFRYFLKTFHTPNIHHQILRLFLSKSISSITSFDGSCGVYHINSEQTSYIMYVFMYVFKNVTCWTFLYTYFYVYIYMIYIDIYYIHIYYITWFVACHFVLFWWGSNIPVIHR